MTDELPPDCTTEGVQETLMSRLRTVSTADPEAVPPAPDERAVTVAVVPPLPVALTAVENSPELFVLPLAWSKDRFEPEKATASPERTAPELLVTRAVTVDDAPAVTVDGESDTTTARGLYDNAVDVDTAPWPPGEVAVIVTVPLPESDTDATVAYCPEPFVVPFARPKDTPFPPDSVTDCPARGEPAESVTVTTTFHSKPIAAADTPPVDEAADPGTGVAVIEICRAPVCAKAGVATVIAIAGTANAVAATIERREGNRTDATLSNGSRCMRLLTF